MTTETAVSISYFGKLPSRGDFVKGSGDLALVATLDRWVGQGIELLAQDSGWKLIYDAAPQIAFAFLGSRSRLVIAGHLAPSRDASERRFPFLSAARMEVAQPLAFIARSPLALSRLWSRLERQTAQVLASPDPTEPLRELADAPLALNANGGAYESPFQDFLEMQTIGSLEDLLRGAGHAVSLRRLLPALGILLQPVLAAGPARLDKGLALPLPADPLYRPLVATFWMDLIAGFLARSDFELALFVGGTPPLLAVGFQGAIGRSLQSVLDPRVGAEQNIRIDDAEWVDDHLDDDYALRKLASYLEQDRLSLRMARTTFRETFLGA